MKAYHFMAACTLSLLLAGCGTDEAKALRKYYGEQVADRMRRLQGRLGADSAAPREVHEAVGRIILVSKDSENSSAAVVMSKQLFDNLCMLYDLPRADFPDLRPGMSLEETEVQLRENELAFFNQVLMRVSADSVFLFTAH